MMSQTRSVFAPLIALALLAGARPAAAQVTDRSQIVFPPLHEFHPQQPRRILLPNGMVIFLQEDHELPLIRGQARIRGGSREEPAEKVGLVQMFGEVWRTGGTKSQTGDQLDDYLEARGAKVESGDGLDSTTLSFDCLKENFDEVFKTFIELLREPELRADKLPLAKDQVNTSISRRNDSPFQISFREAAKLVYGAASPYARVPEYSTVAAVTRDDLVNWHHAYVHPNNMILGVVGDFDSAAMESALRKAFDLWERGPAVKKVQATLQNPKPGIYFIPKDDVTESMVQMVDIGTTRDSPDYYALEVFNQFFGGSFSSRLFSNIRSKKGLAYAVWGGIEAEYDHAGLLRLALGTKNGTTAAAIDAFNDEILALDKNPATVEELKKAKDAILNSFIFRFDTKEKVLSERVADEFYGYPADFLERYRAGIEKVTQEDVARVARKYIRKDRVAVLVVGKAADFDRPLNSFGPVTTLDVSIPAPSAGKSKAAAGSNPALGSNEEGRALLSKVIAGLGGEAKVKTVKSIREKASLQMSTPQGDMAMEVEQVTVFPDRISQKMVGPMGEMSVVVSPAAAFMAAPTGAQDMPASQKEEILSDLKREPILIAQHAGDAKFTFSAGGSEKVGDVEAKILDVNAEGAEVRWFIDPESGRILRVSFQAMGMGGPGERVTDYAGWKSVEGISVPFRETSTRNGQKESSVEIKEYEINPQVDAKLFQKPEAK